MVRRDTALAAALMVLLLLAAPASAYPRPGTTFEVTLTPSGASGSGAPEGCSSGLTCSAQVDVSADGRFVAFNAMYSDLVSGDTNNAMDVFVRDLRTGMTERVSLGSAGQADGASAFPTISDDGRFVAFASEATNLTEHESPGIDIFVRDRELGITRLASIAPDGSMADGRDARSPRISADGRFVAFFSDAFGDDTTNDERLPYGGVNFGNVYVHDLTTGTTELVSVPAGGGRSTSVSVYGSGVDISADGRFVVWDSRRHDLAEGDTNGMVDIFVRDRVDGTTKMVSVAGDGQQGNWMSYNPRISADGTVVAFSSMSSNLVPTDTNTSGRTAGGIDVFVHDVTAGTTERVSVSSDGRETEPGNDSYWLDISADGRFVTFDSTAGALSGSEEYARHVYVHDRVTKTTERVSLPGDTALFTQTAFSAAPAISGDGGVVAFVAAPPQGFDDAVFVRRRGAPLGVGTLAARPAPDGLVVSGEATFDGAVVTSAQTTTANADGRRVSAAEVVYRPEAEDLLVRLDVPGMTTTGTAAPATNYVVPAVGGVPGALHVLHLTVDDRRFQVRAARTGVGATFALYDCADACVQVRELGGGFGTGGEDVRVAIPLPAIAAAPESAVTAVKVESGLGTLDGGVAADRTEMPLPDGALSGPRVEVSPADGSYAPATLGDGSFQAHVPEARAVLARACLGQRCSAPTATEVNP